MLNKTRGIVLHYIKYSETSIIATIYTENFGRQSYMINGIRNKKSKIKANLFQPLYLLNMEVYHKLNKELQHVKEVQPAYYFNSLPFDLKKSSIAIFFAEVLYKTVKEQEANTSLFEYLFSSIQILDLKRDGLVNFHIYFLIHLTKYLGFFPNNDYNENNAYFDLQSGHFCQLKPLHPYFLDKELSKIFSQLLVYSENQHEDFKIGYSDRNKLLEKIIDYYSLHNDSFSGIKSFKVFKDVFH